MSVRMETSLAEIAIVSLLVVVVIIVFAVLYNRRHRK